jgi:hypothetical protein
MYNNLNSITKEYDILMKAYQEGLKVIYLLKPHEELRSSDEVTAILCIDNLACSVPL